MQEKLFYVEIDSLDNEDGCYASNEHFANFFGITKTRVSRVISAMVDKKLISSVIDTANGSKRTLRIIYKFPEIEPCIKVQSPHSTNVQGGVAQMYKGGDNKSATPVIGTDINTDNKTNIVKASKKPDPLADPMIDLVIEAWNEITGQDIKKATLTHRKNIAARLKENPALTLEDFRLVIAGKFKEWNKEPESGRSDTRAWITTNTILGSKFDGYLNSLRMLQKRQVEIDRRAQEDEVPLAWDLMERVGWRP